MASTENTKYNDLADIVAFVKSEPNQGQQQLIASVGYLINIVLAMPANNASSERAFSALRLVKIYLRPLRATTGVCVHSQRQT